MVYCFHLIIDFLIWYYSVLDSRKILVWIWFKDTSNTSLFFPYQCAKIISHYYKHKCRLGFGANWCLLLLASYKLLYFLGGGRDFWHFKILTWDLYNLTIHKGVTLCLWWRPISGTWYCCVLVSLPEESMVISSGSTYKQRWPKK